MTRRIALCAGLAGLTASLMLAACVITAAGTYFDAGDFTVPKVFTGNWVLAPELGTEKTAEVMHVRLMPDVKRRGFYRAQSLKPNGLIDKNEEPAEFGLVALGASKYLLVNVEDDADAKKSNFLGVDAEEDKLTFYLFDGSESAAAKAALTAAVSDVGMSLDPSQKYEARLSGSVTKDKIVALFARLMADPAQYQPDISVYVKTR